MIRLSRRQALIGAGGLAVLLSPLYRFSQGGAVTLFLEVSLDPARAVAHQADAAGMRIISMQGDAGRAAMALDDLWSDRPQPLLGFTSPATAFIVGQLALRRGMGLSFAPSQVRKNDAAPYARWWRVGSLSA